MIDTSEQTTLKEMDLCSTCKNYPCASVIEQRKDTEIKHIATTKCNGYKKVYS